MQKIDLEKLSKKQLENFLFFIYKHLDNQANDYKFFDDKININEDPYNGYFYTIPRKTCNLMDHHLNDLLENNMKRYLFKAKLIGTEEWVFGSYHFSNDNKYHYILNREKFINRGQELSLHSKEVHLVEGDSVVLVEDLEK